MNPFDSYMLNKVRRLKDVRTRYAATGGKALLAGVPEEDREFVTGVWPPEVERILNGGEKTLSETCAEVPLLSVSGGRALAKQRNRKLQV